MIEKKEEVMKLVDIFDKLNIKKGSQFLNEFRVGVEYAQSIEELEDVEREIIEATNELEGMKDA